MTTEQLKLEVGKKYVCRDNLTIRSIVKFANNLYWCNKDNPYEEDGTLLHQLYPEPENHPQDLVRELNEH